MSAQRNALPPTPFLPMTREEMDRLGWDALDVLLVTGDAYVDHPSFGSALLGRWLHAHGYRVGIVAQPRWNAHDDVARMGRPRLFAGVTAGALDSMLAHYTAFRKKRRDDAYTPGGQSGARPNRACIVYTNLVRHAFPGLPVVLGGIEASMRRVSHYDFWTDRLRPSLLYDSKAELLVYGMAERALLDVTRRLDEAGGSGDGVSANILRGIPGTAWIESGQASLPGDVDTMVLPSHEELLAEPTQLMEATLAIEQQVHRGRAWVVQATGGRTTVVAPPPEPLDTTMLDRLHALPFARAAHPSYTEPVPAAAMIQFSITSHRGCAGGCSFCALALHQGRRIRSRSAESIHAEVRRMAEHPAWQGVVTDIGGPTANMWQAECTGDTTACTRASCLWPGICRFFRPAQKQLAALQRSVAAMPEVKHLRTASGIRHDLALKEPAYLQALVQSFVGGQLKLAPEHCADRVLDLMRKPSIESFDHFLDAFQTLSAKAGKEQYTVPYLISAFPGCTDEDMEALAAWLRRRHWRPQQVQCFVPTPGTVATAMYVAGCDPKGVPIPVARTDAERLRQHGLLTRDLKPSTRTRPATQAKHRPPRPHGRRRSAKGRP